jgi:hypothetical protein
MRVPCPDVAVDVSQALITEENLNYIKPDEYNYENLQVKTNQQNDVVIKKHENAVLHKSINTKKQVFSDLPVVSANKNLMVCAADFNCNFMVFKNLENVNNNICFNSNIHCDHIKAVLINDRDNMVITCGENEKMIVQWQVNEILNDRNCLNKDYNSKLQQHNSVLIKSSYLLNHVRFCQFDLRLFTTGSKDGKVLVRGFVSNFLNKLFSKKLSLFERKKQYLPSNVSTVIEFVYSSHAVDRLDSVRYLHYYERGSRSLLNAKGSDIRNYININSNSNSNNNKGNNDHKMGFKKNKDSNNPNNSVKHGKINQVTKQNNNNSNTNNNKTENFPKKYDEKTILKILKYYGSKDRMLESLILQKSQTSFNVDSKNSASNEHFHNNCRKRVVYYNGRFVITKDISKKTQRIYQQHNNKVTAIAVHPVEPLVASSEISLSKVSIHIWHQETFETLKIIKTSHNDGVVDLVYSCNGMFLISLAVNNFNNLLFTPSYRESSGNSSSSAFSSINLEGIKRNDLRYTDIMTRQLKRLFFSFSIQVHQPEFNISLEPRNISVWPVYGVKFFPHSEFLFVTYGFRTITIWEIQYSYLEVVKQIDSQQYYFDDLNKSHFFENFICCDFIISTKNNLVSTNVFFGTSEGNVVGIINNDYVVLKSKAHDSDINCIRIINIEKGGIVNSNTNDNNNNFNTKSTTNKNNLNNLNENNVNTITPSNKFNVYNNSSSGGEMTLILTAGEDSFLKVWDKSFNLLKVWSPFEIENTNFEDDFKRVS